ncbi:MAG: hypothetical protein GQ565_01580 [Candidatus Aegiribacteria sp.]|nr:hypothetical protein [Candidatus Aegiribacteria sp.]
MKDLSKELKSISECKLTKRGIIILLLLTAGYLASFLYISHKMVLLFLAGTALITIFLVKPKPSFWLPAFPLIVIMGVRSFQIGEFNPAIATIAMTAFTFIYVADRILWNKPLFVPSPYLAFFIIAILIQVCSVFISIHIHEQYTWNAIRDASSIYLFFPLAVMIPSICTTESKIDQLLRAMMVSLLIAGALGVFQYLTITGFSRIDMSLGYVYRGRIAGFFMDNPNAFASYLELSVPLSIALFFREKDVRWKITAIAAGILGMLSVLYTFSRGGLICTFIGCGITLLYYFRSKVWVPLLLGVLAISILISYQDTFERQMSFIMNPKEHLNQPTILHRYISYRGFFNQISESPITGVGWGAREFYWGRTLLYSFWEVRHCVSTQTIYEFGGLNSVFLNLLVKGGIIALVSILLTLGVILVAVFKAIRNKGGILAVALAAGMFSFVVHQLIDNTLRSPAINAQFWIITGLILVLGVSDSEKPDTKKIEGSEESP